MNMTKTVSDLGEIGRPFLTAFAVNVLLFTEVTDRITIYNEVQKVLYSN